MLISFSDLSLYIEGMAGIASLLFAFSFFLFPHVYYNATNDFLEVKVVLFSWGILILTSFSAIDRSNEHLVRITEPICAIDWWHWAQNLCFIFLGAFPSGDGIVKKNAG